jgi:hypothetical protein
MLVNSSTEADDNGAPIGIWQGLDLCFAPVIATATYHQHYLQANRVAPWINRLRALLEVDSAATATDSTDLATQHVVAAHIKEATRQRLVVTLAPRCLAHHASVHPCSVENASKEYVG